MQRVIWFAVDVVGTQRKDLLSASKAKTAQAKLPFIDQRGCKLSRRNDRSSLRHGMALSILQRHRTLSERKGRRDLEDDSVFQVRWSRI